MFYYFCCNYPSAIKINGIYYGTLTCDVKCLRIEENFKPLVEICALNGHSKTVNFILDKDFLENPPENFLITDLKGGYMIKANDTLHSGKFEVVKQQKLKSALVTVFNENGLKISIETHGDFFVETVNFCPNDTQITEFSLDGEYFIAVFMQATSNLLAVYKVQQSVKKVFFREVDSFCVTPTFTTTEKLNDIAKHTVTSTWQFLNQSFERTALDCTCSQDFDFNTISEDILPFAFFEEIIVGGNYQDYLIENMKKHAQKLKGFLGDFIGIIPPPKFRKIDEIGLIYKSAENRYFTKYFTVELENRKIVNIKKSDD